MKSLLKSNKASATVIVSVLALCVITGGVIVGAYFAKNRVTYITYQEALNIASSIPEVAEFIENNDITSVSAERVDAVWIAEFYADQLNYTADYTRWQNYAIVKIDAITGYVMYYQIYDPNNPHYTEEEIIQIANSISEISDWLDEQAYEVFINAWFDGYDNYWYVEYYANGSSSQAMVIISDLTGEVIEYNIYDPFANATKTKEEIISIVEDVPEVQAWFIDNPTYYCYVDFYDEPYYNSTSLDGFWVVEYYAYHETRGSWIIVYVDDLSGDILAIDQSYEPQLTEEEVILIASLEPEVAEFLLNLTEYRTSVWYNEYCATWSVYFENSYNFYEYAIIDIDDATASVLSYEINIPEEHNLTGEEVYAIAIAIPEVQSWLDEIGEYFTYIGCRNGLWYVDFFINNNSLGNLTIPPEGLIVSYNIVIEDATGLVIEINPIVLTKID
ncbi:MAG: hypothetical protein FK734_11015 [Asgard group archaeon]|nr:hypothetical protein [Asgard group archaeon]